MPRGVKKEGEGKAGAGRRNRGLDAAHLCDAEGPEGRGGQAEVWAGGLPEGGRGRSALGQRERAGSS